MKLAKFLLGISAGLFLSISSASAAQVIWSSSDPIDLLTWPLNTYTSPKIETKGFENITLNVSWESSNLEEATIEFQTQDSNWLEWTEVASITNTEGSESFFITPTADFVTLLISADFDGCFFCNYLTLTHLEITGEQVVTAVPLPAAIPLFGAGVAIIGLLGWRKKRHA